VRLNAVAIVAVTAVGEADGLVAAVDGPAGVVADAIVVAMAVADVVVMAAVVVEAGTRDIALKPEAARKIAAFFLSRNLIVEAFPHRGSNRVRSHSQAL